MTDRVTSDYTGHVILIVGVSQKEPIVIIGSYMVRRPKWVVPLFNNGDFLCVYLEIGVALDSELDFDTLSTLFL